MSWNAYISLLGLGLSCRPSAPLPQRLEEPSAPTSIGPWQLPASSLQHCQCLLNFLWQCQWLTSLAGHCLVCLTENSKTGMAVPYITFVPALPALQVSICLFPAPSGSFRVPVCCIRSPLSQSGSILQLILSPNNTTKFSDYGIDACTATAGWVKNG